MRSALHRLIVRVLVPALLVACVKFEQVLEIKADGSGTLQVTMLFEKQLVDRLTQQGDPLDVKAMRKRFAKLEGVRLTKVERIARADSKRPERKLEGLNVVIGFESPDALRSGMKALARTEGSAYGNAMQLWFVRGKDGSVRFVFYPSGRSEYERAKRAVARYAKLDAKGKAAEDAMFARMKSSLADLEISYRFKLPGAIRKVAGAKKVGPNEVLMTVAGGSMRSMADVMRVSGLRFEVEFDGRDFKAPLIDREPGQPARLSGPSK